MSLENQNQIPDNAPVIAMNAKLKEHLEPGEVIDIDYDALARVMGHVEAPHDNSNLTVNIDEPRSKLNPTRGHFEMKNGGNLVVRFDQNEKKVNATFRHELKHYSDYEKGILGSTRSKVITGIGNVGVLSAIPVATAQMAGYLVQAGNSLSEMKFGSPFIPREALESTLETTRMVQMGTTALMGFYWFNPYERAARKAEKKKLPPVITHSTSVKR